MYLFEAHYINTKTGKEITRTIEFHGYNFFDTEKERFMYAMGKAYDLKEDNEIFDSLEFISC